MKKITIEKNKEFQKNELEKSNIKQLNFSLMKKHLFSLMMAFALIVGLSASAWAQTTLPAAAAATEGSYNNPKVYLNGATGSVSLTRGVAGSVVVWTLYKGATANAANIATATATPTPLSTEDLDISGSGTTWTASQTTLASDAGTPTFHFKWTDAASGTYYLEAVETDQTHTCAYTKRGYFMFIFGFDVEVYASTETGTRLNTGDLLLATCGDNEYDAFLNDVQMATDGTLRTDLFNGGTTTANTLIPTDGTLTAAYGNKKTKRYYTAEIHFDGRPDGTGTTGTFDPSSLGILSATMDISVGGTNVTVKDVMNINLQTTDLADDVNSVTTTAVAKNATGNTFTFEVDLADRWGTNNLQPTATVTNLKLYPAANGAGTAIGEEPTSKEDTTPTDDAIYDNTSNSITIYSKPATSIITAN